MKTCKLYIGGAFPRSESGRSLPVRAAGAGSTVLAHISHASRKDLRDAVEAARKALAGWSGATAYNRGQVLYRLAEMMEGKRAELEGSISRVQVPRARGRSAAALAPRREVTLSIDRLVSFAGWADKYAQVLGCNNPVAGPFYNFTTPEPTGVVAAVAPDGAPLLALISLIAPAICAGNTVVAVASDANPLPAVALSEACATSDFPAGVVNLLTGRRAELIPHIAGHRDIDAVHAANLDGAQTTALRAGAAENVKRVTVRTVADWADAAECTSPWWIEPMVELKTVWHPSGA